MPSDPLLGHRHEGDAFDEHGKLRERAGQPVDPVDDDNIDAPVPAAKIEAVIVEAVRRHIGLEAPVDDAEL
jgi:hypothetical protein